MPSRQQQIGHAGGLTSYAIRTPEQEADRKRANALQKARMQVISLKSVQSPKLRSKKAVA